MRHRKAGLKLNRTSSHRKAMFRNMVTSLIKYDQIRTTDVKAKELRRWGDKLVTLAKRGDLHARRLALSIVRERAVVKKLFDEAPKRFGTVSGGYTRVIKLGRRPGDAATMSLVSFVTPDDAKKKRKKKKPTSAAVTTSSKVLKDKTTESIDEPGKGGVDEISTSPEPASEVTAEQAETLDGVEAIDSGADKPSSDTLVDSMPDQNASTDNTSEVDTSTKDEIADEGDDLKKSS